MEEGLHEIFSRIFSYVCLVHFENTFSYLFLCCVCTFQHELFYYIIINSIRRCTITKFFIIFYPALMVTDVFFFLIEERKVRGGNIIMLRYLYSFNTTFKARLYYSLNYCARISFKLFGESN